MKICLHAFIGSENLGDEAICHAIVSDMSQRGFEIDIISTNPSVTRTLLRDIKADVNIIDASNSQENRKSIQNCDVFVCGGGGLIQDHTSVFNIPRYLKRVSYALKRGKPVMFYGISAGPIRFYSSKYLVRRILSKVDCITVRDSSSIEVLKNLGVPSTIVHQTADPALNLKSCSQKEARRILDEHGLKKSSSITAVSLRHWFDTYPLIPVSIVKKLGYRSRKDKNLQSNFIDQFAIALDKIAEHSQILFVPFWPSRDGFVHQKIAEKMSHQSVHLDGSLSPSKVKGVLKEIDFLVGMRLHSLILAAPAEKPMIAINYSSKVEGFLRTLYEKSYCESICVDPSRITAVDVLAAYNFARQNFDNAIKKGVIKNSQQKEKKNGIYLQGLAEK